MEINNNVLSEKLTEKCFADMEKGSLETYNSLPVQAREYFRLMYEKYKSGDTSAISSLYSLDYEHKRVDPHTFFTHSDYLGHFKEYIYPAWWKHILYVCNPNNGIYEIILTGALGLGKTLVGNGLILAYHLHRLLCLRDPAAFFGLGKKSKIILGIYSLDLKSAEDAGFFVLRDQLLRDSPFFNSIYRPSPYGTDEIVFPKNIVIKTGSTALHAAGKNLFGIAIDEMNLMKKGKTTAKKAFMLANSVSRRIEDRFMQVGGEIPGITLMIGSAGAANDFIELRAKYVKDQPGHYVVQGAVWDFKPRKYCGKNFRVQVGNATQNSKILDIVHSKGKNDWVIQTENEPAQDCQVIFVPVEHYSSFKVDVEGACRDLAGVSSVAAYKLFSDRNALMKSFDLTIPHPFPDEVVLGYLGCGYELSSLLNIEKICCVRNGVYSPIRSPQSPRYLHLDLAKNGDIAGLTMLHPSAHYIAQEATYESQIEGEKYFYDIQKSIEVDFCLGIMWGPQREHIDFANIRRLIFFLRSIGFWIRVVTLDSYQSEDTLQRLTEAKILSEILSVDRNAVPYTITRNCCYGGRLKMPSYKKIFEELTALDYDVSTNKVDHPEGGSKDIADSLCGATYRCLIDKIAPRDVPLKRIEDNKSDFDSFLIILKKLKEMQS